ncbi:MAG TPA: hypothetical protein VN864_08285 [Thermoplasmata archaeon]|nr:hypothetical protein [Thermoplasmata archaeon]
MSTTTTTTTYGYRRNSAAGELPILVGLLAILIALFGVFFLVVGLLIVGTSVGILGLPSAGAFAVVSGGALLAGVVTLVFGAVLVTVATGLWDLELWALVLTGLVVAVIIALLVVASDFGWSLVIAVGLLLYLVLVRDHFY